MNFSGARFVFMRSLLVASLVWASGVAVSGCNSKSDTIKADAAKSAIAEKKEGEAAKPAGASVAAASAPAPLPEIVLGEIGSLTGSEATFGISTKEGVDLAIKQFNDAAGATGRKARVIVYDDQGKAEEAATAATKLTQQDKVLAIIGEVASTRTIAAAPIAQAAGVPLVTPASTNPKVTELGDNVFRVCFVDQFQGTVLAIFAAENLKAGTAAILRDTKSDYSIGLANEFTARFKEFGGSVVADEAYTGGDLHFKAQLTKIRGKKPDVLFVPGYYTEVGLIARQAKELGLKAKLLGGDGWNSEKLNEIAGDALEGSYFSSHYSSEAPSDMVKKFVADYQAAYKRAPDSFAALGYDAALVVLDAVRRAEGGGVTPKAVREALVKTAKLHGVTGLISIDEKRNATKPAVVLKLQKGGKLEYATTINPYPFPH